MCGRYYRISDKQKIAEAFHATITGEMSLPDTDYNVAPTTMQPIIRQSRDTGQREMLLARWGLIPYGIDLTSMKHLSTVNAKAENLNRGIWTRPLKTHRCIVPASGLYEWKKLSAGGKQPYAFDLANGHMFGFAGLWDAWKQPKKSPQAVDTWVQSFTIITTDANELMAPVHNRMPVLLHERDFDRWLYREDTERLPIDLLRPFPTDEMEAIEVSKDVGNVRNNSPELLNSV